MLCGLHFFELYRRDPQDVAFCPYRICPIGAHSDHQHGKVTVCSLQFDKRAQWHIAGVPAIKLYPLTENFPKPLLEVAGKSMLDWLIEDIDTAGTVYEYIVVSNHKFVSHFENWASERNGSHAYSSRITVLDDGTSSNETRLGAVCDIKFAVDILGLDDELLVVAGDNLLDFSLKSFLDYAGSKRTSCVMRHDEPDVARRHKCAVACIDGGDLITNFEEKPSEPHSHWACPPFLYTGECRMDREGHRVGVRNGCFGQLSRLAVCKCSGSRYAYARKKVRYGQS